VARTSSADYFVLDIETVPDAARWHKQEDRPDAFPPNWAHKIIVVGYLWLDHKYRIKRQGVISLPDERALIAELSRMVGAERPTLVTYNGRGFDLPVIAVRALCHGVPLPWYYKDRSVRARYTEEGHFDLCDWLADHGATRAGGLDAIARLIGLPGKVGVDGSQVEGLYAAGDLDAIEQYCLGDVAQTALLFLRFRLLQGQLAPDDYRARTDELLAALAGDARTAPIARGTDRAHLLA
jgi:predicted PolB exonuclease-like 3'-5' exonuclease